MPEMLVLGTIRKVLLVDEIAIEVVGVLVAFMVTELLHEFGGCVSQMQWHRQVSTLPHKLQSVIYCHVCRVALGACREIDGSLGQRDSTFRHSDFVDSVECRIGEQQSVGVGKADVLTGRDDQPSRDKKGVFPTLNHAG